MRPGAPHRGAGRRRVSRRNRARPVVVPFGPESLAKLERELHRSARRAAADDPLAAALRQLLQPGDVDTRLPDLARALDKIGQGIPFGTLRRALKAAGYALRWDDRDCWIRGHGLTDEHV